MSPGGTPTAAAIEDWNGGRSLVVVLQSADDRVLVAVHGDDAPCALPPPPPRPGCPWQPLADSAGAERRTRPPQPPAAGRGTPGAPRRPRRRPWRCSPPRRRRRHRPRLARPGLAGAPCAGGQPAGPVAGSLGLPADCAAQAHDSLHRLTAPRALPASLTLAAGQPCALSRSARRWPGPGGSRRCCCARRTAASAASLVRPGGWGPGRPGDPPHRPAAAAARPPPAVAEECDGLTCLISVVPAACACPPTWPPARRFGIAAQTYGLRPPGDQGIGDYAALAELARGGGAARRLPASASARRMR